MTLIKILLEPDKPLWLKVGAVIVIIALLVAWWTRPFWHDLQTPSKTERERKARPPF